MIRFWMSAAVGGMRQRKRWPQAMAEFGRFADYWGGTQQDRARACRIAGTTEQDRVRRRTQER
jgi:hypothetical protein